MAPIAEPITEPRKTRPREILPDAYRDPDAVSGSIGSSGASLAHKKITISGIDDSFVVDFSLEKFNSFKFTVLKKISLFFEDTFPFFVQSMFLPVFYIIYHSIFDLHIHGKEHVKQVNGPVLFISNHISFYDCFIFDLFVHPFSHILPYRFMGAKVFIVPALAVLKVVGIIDLVYLLFGVFRVTPGEGAERSLKSAYEIIKRGGTVVIYPEGRIWKPTNVHPEAIGPFKWGSAILAKNTNIQVIPVAFKRIISDDNFRTKIDVFIGEPYFVNGQDTPEAITDDMYERVVNLYEHGEEKFQS